jgi:predicted metalloprotease with PDZ domain
MEHRNSTIVTASTGTIGQSRADLLDTIAHEFFHSWNVERIRPKSLEPFNLEETNMSGELWLAEGVTSYYGPLVQLRAGVTRLSDFTDDIGRAISTVLVSPGRRVRSAVEMSQQAPFVDAAVSIDRTDTYNTFISYFTWGTVIGVGLDLALRDRSDNKITLDHFMRALWQKFGKPGGRAPGYVDHPYTLADVRAMLAEISGDATFAREFFEKYIEGHDVVDFQRLLARAGLLLRPIAPGQAYAGNVRLTEGQDRARVSALVPMGSPAYLAGLEREDVVISAGAKPVTRGSDFEAAVQAQKPGDSLPVVFERRGQRITSVIKLIEDPRREVVPAEMAGQTLTPAQKQFRDAWLSSQRNAF